MEKEMKKSVKSGHADLMSQKIKDNLSKGRNI